jgi:arylsulfatase A-like enzyme
MRTLWEDGGVKAPNILVVMADQHRADVLGCAGDDSAQTPTLDGLAAEGTRFSAVTCQGPLCMPARASFATERYVRDHGVYTNWAEVASGTPTYMGALRDAGYHTVLLGKAHLYRDETHTAEHVDELAPRLRALGFAEVHETGDKFSTSMRNPYLDALHDNGVLDAYAQYIRDRSYQGENETGRGATKRVPMWDATPSPLPPSLYIDAWHGELAARWISEYDGDAPFFAFVGFPGPHDPWDAPANAVARYAGADVTMPRTTVRPDVDGAGTYGRLLGAFLHLSDTTTMTADAIRGMRTAYSANVSVIDDAVARILAALEAKGMLEDTWVVYTSDHGEMAGDHGLMSKCVLYDGAVRVPLIVRPPRSFSGERGNVVDALVEHVDVPATMRDLGGAPPIEQSVGRSLLPYLRGDDAPHRTCSISENWGFASFVTERYKLVVDEDAGVACQLFDRDDDPAEDENLVADPQHATVVDELMTTLVTPFFATPASRPHPSPFTG